MVDTCPVCYDEISKSETLSCKHKIHAKCIVNSGKAVCPICRAKLQEFVGKVNQLIIDHPEQSILDKLLCYGYIHPNDIPIFDKQGITNRDELTIVKAALIAFAIRSTW